VITYVRRTRHNAAPYLTDRVLAARRRWRRRWRRRGSRSKCR
jgi:hypothetical protein